MCALMFKLKALTPIWTGGIKRNDNTKLRFTGIKGSIRWWYEALVRGLDFFACDPRPNDGGCSFNIKEVPQSALGNASQFNPEVKKQICPVCYLFGCTGWSGKFSIRITTDDRVPRDLQILDHETPFDLHFIQLKELEPIEKILIEKTVKLIVDYGAIGGKTVLKPSEFDYKNVKAYKGLGGARGHHLDYGILGRVIENNIDVSGLSAREQQYEGNNSWRSSADQYLKNFLRKENNQEWPDLRYFWFIPDFAIRRNKFIEIIQNYNDHNWLGGRQTVSKKIFSFHGIRKKASILQNQSASQNDKIAGIERSFGYTKRELTEFNKVKELITNTCTGITIKTGEEVLNEL